MRDREAMRILDERIQRALRRLRIGARRGRITLVEAVDEAGSRLKAAVSSLQAGSEVEQSRPSRLMQHYGFASRPLPDSEAIVIAIGSRGGQGVIIATEDSQYRIDLEDGEVALYDQHGQYVHLKTDSTVHVKAAGDIVLNDGSDSNAATGDAVSATPDMATWLASVGAATAVGAPPGTFGTIDETSRTVKS